MSFLQDSYVMLNDRQSGRFFNIMLGFSQLCGAFAIIAAVIWMGSYENGFAWSDDPERQFHYHPTFMTMGLIFLFGEGRCLV
ncbi:hypothetical protein AB6A40_002117 [Gnathostoma spinigerum]|uniref:Cytochrome b561 domain-containing protein n=1 Tax=Gnathostoma spinigerum TaxID=75299 RepID=A0ABD6E5X6_9BILA